MLGQMVNVSACPRCQGEGKIIEIAVRDVQGRRPHRAATDAPRHDPAGIDEGHQIRLSNEGEAGPRAARPGSLYVAVHVAPHPSLKRDGTELYYEAEVSIAQAALGTRIMVPDRRRRRGGRDQAGTQPETEIRLRGKGVPHLRRAGRAATST